MIVYSVKTILGLFIGLYGLLAFLLSVGGLAKVQMDDNISYRDTAFAWWIIFFHLIIYTSLLMILLISRNNIKPYLYTCNMFTFYISILAALKMVETHTILSYWRTISPGSAVNALAVGFIFMTFQDIFVGLVISIFDKYHMVNDCFPSLYQSKDNHETTLNNYPVSHI